MDLGLSGSRVIVTGASRGIGLATARVFAKEGADLAICARSPEPLEEAAAGLREAGGVVHTRALDVADTAALDAFVDSAAQYLGGIDIVVSNVSAGSSRVPDQWERNFATDLLPFVRLAERAHPHLVASERSGAIILVSTTSALHTTRPAGAAAYGAVKAALNHHAASLARAWAGEGIRVNTVSPGPVDFPGSGWDRRRETDFEYYETIRKRIPCGRLGRPEEIARAIAFLASPASAFTTGQNLVVDGGFLDRV
ncbi:SDR family NAD(P)-dependent oxidoreductase [Nocardiopsis sp. LOL_012]|uniref:SDR family NAD(P)-dependent oxidoreductase n=1 Tax=Nocardiopsis sp. LOL_012 TaxID=3345409 RepID=UPI003A8AE289